MDVPQGPGVFFPDGDESWENVIHKIIEVAIYIGFGFEYNDDMCSCSTSKKRQLLVKTVKLNSRQHDTNNEAR